MIQNELNSIKFPHFYPLWGAYWYSPNRCGDLAAKAAAARQRQLRFLEWIEVQLEESYDWLEALRSNNMDLDWLIGGIEVQLEELFDKMSKIEVQNLTFFNEI